MEDNAVMRLFPPLYSDLRPGIAARGDFRRCLRRQFVCLFCSLRCCSSLR
jgi:hypothetical protein